MRAAANLLAALIIALAAMLSDPGTARADAQLDTLRASGAVAERFDGYVEVRDAGTAPNARAVVDDVNAKRRALYEKRAKESNVPVAEVGKLFATKLVETAPAGTYFRQPDGSYARK